MSKGELMLTEAQWEQFRAADKAMAKHRKQRAEAWDRVRKNFEARWNEKIQPIITDLDQNVLAAVREADQRRMREGVES